MVMPAGEVMKFAGELVEALENAQPPLTDGQLEPFTENFFDERGIGMADRLAVGVAYSGIGEELKYIREL
jgi:hypothetical protein